MKECKILRDNSISLEGLVFEGKKVVYTNIHYGANIKYSSVCSKSNGKVIRWKEITWEQMKGRYFLVIITIQECLKSVKDTFIVGTSNADFNYELSFGIIVLSICNLGIKSHIGRSQSRGEYESIRRCKENIIQGQSQQRGSTGYFYAFGNKANYGIVNDSSIVPGVNITYKTKEKTGMSKYIENMLEGICVHELGLGINGLLKVIPTMRSLIAPVMNKSYQLQD